MPDSPRPNRSERVALYAGSFDPPASHHFEIARRLSQVYEQVVIVSNGPRPDRFEEESLPIHRAVMADLNFRRLPRVTVELQDLERNRFTPNHALPEMLGRNPDSLSHVVSATWVAGGARGESQIQTKWEQGQEMWRTAHFTILHPEGTPPAVQDMPPHAVCVAVPVSPSSEEIRFQLLEGRLKRGLLMPEVEEYVRRHGLFRATAPARDCPYRIESPRLKLVYEAKNAGAVELAEKLRPFEHPDPELIAVIGGDGTMLRAIRAHWRERLPFYGFNLGHLGFLLNDRETVRFWERDLRLYQLPLLWVEMTTSTGTRIESLAFNDCWLERQTGQTAWVEVAVNGEVRMPRVVADGMLVATAAGSTSYARAMRATPLPFNTPLLTLAGSNVLIPEFWQPAVLPLNSSVTVRNLDADKRPLQGFVDGVDYGAVVEMTVRVSNIAAVELLFAHAHDPVAKLAMLQFPQPG
ncbi:MAG: NAD(+)/NADH kinase [Fimbriiglobus sp.]